MIFDVTCVIKFFESFMLQFVHSWSGEKMNLDDINIKCEGDKVVVIAGAVGSGKVGPRR